MIESIKVSKKSNNILGSYLELSTYCKGERVCRVYEGYKQSQAIRLFKEYLEEQYKWSILRNGILVYLFICVTFFLISMKEMN